MSQTLVQRTTSTPASRPWQHVCVCGRGAVLQGSDGALNPERARGPGG
jgi:hypothetical protein